jgi:hypothetical protein
VRLSFSRSEIIILILRRDVHVPPAAIILNIAVLALNSVVVQAIDIYAAARWVVWFNKTIPTWFPHVSFSLVDLQRFYKGLK